MQKPLFYTILFLYALALTSTSSAQLQIVGVNYDPLGSDTGKEWVQLFNNGDDIFNLSSITLQTGNGGNQNDWKNAWQGHGILLPKRTLLIGENQGDILATLDLQNGPDAVRMLDSNEEILDLVGWGEHEFDEYYEGQPTADEGDGYVLLRSCSYTSNWNCQDTDNNEQDFIAVRNASPLLLPASQGDLIQAIFPSQEQTIQVTVADDVPSQEGTQIVPRSQQHTVNTTVELSGFIGDYVVEQQLVFNQEIIDQTTTTVQCDNNCSAIIPTTLPSFPQQGVYQVQTTVNNISSQQEFEVSDSFWLTSTVTHQSSLDFDQRLWHIGVVDLTNHHNDTIVALLTTSTVPDILVTQTNIANGRTYRVVLEPNQARSIQLSVPMNQADQDLNASVWVVIQ